MCHNSAGIGQLPMVLGLAKGQFVSIFDVKSQMVLALMEVYSRKGRFHRCPAMFS